MPITSTGVAGFIQVSDGDGGAVWQSAPSAGGNFGQATVPFATFKTEDSIAVTGQAAILSTSRVNVTLLADSDDVVAQDWNAPYVTSLVAGTGFTINLRPQAGSFRGAVKLNWSWG